MFARVGHTQIISIAVLGTGVGSGGKYSTSNMLRAAGCGRTTSTSSCNVVGMYHPFLLPVMQSSLSNSFSSSPIALSVFLLPPVKS